MIGFRPKDEEPKKVPKPEIEQPKPLEVTPLQPDRYHDNIDKDDYPSDVNTLLYSNPTNSILEIPPRNPEL